MVPKEPFGSASFFCLVNFYVLHRSIFTEIIANCICLVKTSGKNHQFLFNFMCDVIMLHEDHRPAFHLHDDLGVGPRRVKILDRCDLHWGMFVALHLELQSDGVTPVDFKTIILLFWRCLDSYFYL